MKSNPKNAVTFCHSPQVIFSSFECRRLELELPRRKHLFPHSQGTTKGVTICQKWRLLRCHIKLSVRRFTNTFPGRYGLPGRPHAFLANQALSRTQRQTLGRAVALSDEHSNKGGHQGDSWGPIHSEDYIARSARAGLIKRGLSVYKYMQCRGTPSHKRSQHRRDNDDWIDELETHPTHLKLCMEGPYDVRYHVAGIRHKRL